MSASIGIATKTLDPSFHIEEAIYTQSLPDHVTVPTELIQGDEQERNKIVKELWIEELGGRCTNCYIEYGTKEQGVKGENIRGHRRKVSILHAHYTGPNRASHVGSRLGDLKVPSPKDPENQQRYLREFVEKMCLCKLLCAKCHGAIHGRESGQRIFLCDFQFNCKRLSR